MMNQHRILPVSSLQNGAYGLQDVCISVPTVLGRTGVVEQVEVDLWPKERTGLQNSGRVLQETIAKVL